MAATRTITQQIRFLFTAVTLLCVLLLNNQEIPTYRPVVKSNSKADSHLHSHKKEKTVVKQKVSFEATTSYFILQPVFLTRWFIPAFFTPVSNALEYLLQPNHFIHFFSVLFGFTIIPNAP